MAHWSNKSKTLALSWLVMVLLLCVALTWQLSRTSSPIETNIMALLPKDKQDPSSQFAFDNIATSMSNKVIFLVGSQNKSNAIAAASELTKKLDDLSLFSHIQGKMGQDSQQAWGKFYYPNRFQMLTSTQRKQLQTSSAKQTQHVIQSVYNPFSGVTGAELQNDPFLLFRDFLTQLSANSGNFVLSNGFLTAQYQGKTYALINAELKGSPYALDLQSKLPALNALQHQIEQSFTPASSEKNASSKVEILHTGVIFYAAHGTESAKSEISTIGVGSLIGIILLILFIYRSITPLNLALLSIACGLLSAFVVTVSVFGKVHLFSLVFGASLIGVSIDYAFHYLTDRLAAGKNWDSQQGLRHIFISISFGLITSLIGYLGMLVAPFPGLQQLALFSAVGLCAAYASVVCWYPILASTPSKVSKLPLTQAMSWWLELWHKRSVRIGLPLTLFIMIALGLSQATYNDDIRQLQALPVQLKQQENSIKAISGIENGQQMLLVKAKNEQALLQRLEQVSKQLDGFVTQDKLQGYQSLTQYIPSALTQHQNYQLSQQLYAQQGAKLKQSLKLRQKIEFDAQFKPVTVNDFLASPISDPVRFMWLGKIEGQQSAVVRLTGLKDAAFIQRYANSQSNLTYLDKTDDISRLFGLYRERVAELLALASAIIFMVVALRYGVKQGIKIMIPPLIAGGAGIAVTVLTGTPLNLFNLLALILILGIGIDYTLFFAEYSRAKIASTTISHSQPLHSTLLAISLSGLTTLLSFGLLALSDTQAIHSFGITVLFGIIVCWLLAPLAMKVSASKISS
ncbi:MMPL family transporter [Vibrio sp. S11_S32]|uniref:MMPL family transporter n=1 Tax=Vibrio sp. S11_S32 TaxID=2720225 RepID=UPI001680B9D7|nr:MMPL family transporter [Vibrio sp. S11_S32]MBD1575178.1 MMPL family transporter [Vibrio sp. S11_S32]